MRRTTLILGTLLVWPIATATAQDDYEKVDCHKDLKRAVELVEDRWSFKLFKPGSVDFEAAYEELAPEAKGTDQPIRCADIISRFMAKLQDGHSRLGYFPGVEKARPALIVKSKRERLSSRPGVPPRVHAYVFLRDTADDVLASIPRGSEIVEIDGVPIPTIYDSLSARAAGSTPQWRDYICDRELLVGPADSELELTYREPGGQLKSATLKRIHADTLRKLPAEVREHLGYRDISSSHKLEGGWGYIRYTSFSRGSLKRTIELFDQALDSVFDAPGIIIDVRSNGGGYVDAFEAIAGRFLSEETLIGYFNVRYPGQEVIVPYYDETRGGYETKVRLMAKPRKPIYSGPVVILIDRECFSACEGFAGGLKSVGRALIVGPEASGGGSGFVGGLRLPSGAIISFSWTVAWLPDGQIIETHGVAPDIRVRERARDWAAGRDRVLERAIRALERNEARPLLVTSQEEAQH